MLRLSKHGEGFFISLPMHYRGVIDTPGICLGSGDG